MTKVVYHIVEHDGGWAYKVEGVFSETASARHGREGAKIVQVRRHRSKSRTAIEQDYCAEPPCPYRPRTSLGDAS